MYNDIKIEIEKYLEKYPPAMRVYKTLMQVGYGNVNGQSEGTYGTSGETLSEKGNCSD